MGIIYEHAFQVQKSHFFAIDHGTNAQNAKKLRCKKKL